MRGVSRLSADKILRRNPFNRKKNCKILRTVDSSVEELAGEMETSGSPSMEENSRKLIEFFCSRALDTICRGGKEKLSASSFSRLTFDMMVAWERPGNHRVKI